MLRLPAHCHWEGRPYILVSPQGLADVAGGELVQLLVVAEHDHGDVDGTEDGELVCLFEQAAFPFEECSVGDGREHGGRARRGGSEAAWPDTYTERLRSSLIARISIFLRPILPCGTHVPIVDAWGGCEVVEHDGGRDSASVGQPRGSRGRVFEATTAAGSGG